MSGSPRVDAEGKPHPVMPGVVFFALEAKPLGIYARRKGEDGKPTGRGVFTPWSGVCYALDAPEAK